jgi:hypothetical protein
MKKIIALLVASVLFFSCSHEKVKSSENYIEKFNLEGISPIEINIFPISKLIYVWTNASNYDALIRAKKNIKISDYATLDSTGNNWTDPSFKYIVMAESGEKREYSVQIDTANPKKHSFESWTLSNDGINGYYVLSNMRWASGNQGIGMALTMLSRDGRNPENYPTKKTTEGYVGNGVLLETIAGGSVFGKNIPIFSGNLFFGNFNVGKALDDPLAATELGKLYLTKPKSITGYYKYKEGDGNFLTGDPSKNDSCDIYAAFYQAKDDGGKEIILTAKEKDDLDKLPYVLTYSRLQDCSTTEGEDFHQFVLNFDSYKSEPNFEKYDYKLFITFAASRGGDTYEGKIGSKLIVDEVEIEDY